MVHATPSQKLLASSCFADTFVFGCTPAGLAAVCKAEFAAATAAAKDAAGVREEQVQDGGGVGRGHRHYAAQWLELLAACLLPAQEASKQQQLEEQQLDQQPKKKRARREGQKATAAGQQGAQALQVGDAVGSVLRMLPWALERYCTALGKYRRAAETGREHYCLNSAQMNTVS